MRTTILVTLAAFCLTMGAPTLRADIPPPVPPAKDVKFTIELDEKAKTPRLIVPVQFTRAQFRPRGPIPGGPKALPPGKEPLAVLDVDDASSSPVRNPNHLMIAGVALTLALGFGGVWFVRRHGRATNRGLALLLTAGGILVTTTLVWANAPPPPPPPGPPVVLPVAFDGQVNLEVTVGGDSIRLILDKQSYEKIKKDPIVPGER